jgi:hypothetical protein
MTSMNSTFSKPFKMKMKKLTPIKKPPGRLLPKLKKPNKF